MATVVNRRSQKAQDETDRHSSLGRWLRAIRAEQRLSQRGLADRAGLSRSYVCDIERGRGSQPSMNTLDKLAAALGLSRNELMKAAGMIEGGPNDRQTDNERRLLAVFRDLDDSGQSLVMRFARFIHTDEHTWVQPGLEVGDASSRSRPLGPTLFDLDS